MPLPPKRLKKLALLPAPGDGGFADAALLPPLPPEALPLTTWLAAVRMMV